MQYLHFDIQIIQVIVIYSIPQNKKRFDVDLRHDSLALVGIKEKVFLLSTVLLELRIFPHGFIQ